MASIKHVCFDLGGVLVRIGTHWGQIAESAGVAHKLTHEVPRQEFETFNLHEEGLISREEYLAALAILLGCTVEEADRAHMHILIEPYPGTEELVAEIHAKGLTTGCLSNTNAPHWYEMRESGRLPAIKALQQGMASYAVKLAKPDHAIFNLYCETFGVKPEEIAYFDDAAPNVVGAAECGFIATRIDPNGDTAAQVRARLQELGAL